MNLVLDILIPSFNRPSKLYAFLKSGMDLDLDYVHFVVIDDGSFIEEDVSDLGRVGTREVCMHFKDDRIVYIRNEINIGLANSWVNYFSNYSQANYVMSVVDKDEFVDGSAITEAVEKMDRDPSLCMVFIPIIDHNNGEDFIFDFKYEKLTGREFVKAFVRDEALQHTGGYAIKRMRDLQKAGVPRNMNLDRYGLQDAFGIDIDLVLMLSTQGNVGFTSRPYVKRCRGGRFD